MIIFLFCRHIFDKQSELVWTVAAAGNVPFTLAITCCCCNRVKISSKADIDLIKLQTVMLNYMHALCSVGTKGTNKTALWKGTECKHNEDYCRMKIFHKSHKDYNFNMCLVIWYVCMWSLTDSPTFEFEWWTQLWVNADKWQCTFGHCVFQLSVLVSFHCWWKLQCTVGHSCQDWSTQTRLCAQDFSALRTSLKTSMYRLENMKMDISKIVLLQNYKLWIQVMYNNLFHCKTIFSDSVTLCKASSKDMTSLFDNLVSLSAFPLK